MNKGLKRFLSAALSLAMVASGMGTMTAVATTGDYGTMSEREVRNAKLSKAAAEDGMVLLENEDALPVASGSSVAVFGTGSYGTIKGGTGSGDVYNLYAVTILEGLSSQYKISNQTWWDSYIKTFTEKKELAATEKKDNDYVDYTAGSFGGAATFVAIDQPLTQADMDAAKADGTSVAFYTISRTSGEGADRKIDKGDYYLSDVEEANIKLMAANFDKTVVLLNVGGIVDTKFYTEIADLDGLVLVSQGGMEMGNAVADILTGAVSPSGKLSDTWAVNYSDYPASATIANNDGNATQEDYTEGIYVGYRYFDTFNVTPAYAFGYGLSYTDFDITVKEVKADAENVSVKVNVKNTGALYSGKEVVEVYFSAPEGNLETAYQELAGYGKTDVLAPGESQEMTITYQTTEMGSYDEAKAAYIMEDGEYILRVGNSSRNTSVAAVLTVADDVITEQLSNQLECDKDLVELSAAGVTPYGYAAEADEIATAERIAIDFSAYVTPNNASTIDEEVVTTYVNASKAADYVAAENETVVEVADVPEGTKLIDVYNGKVSLESFVANLTNAELANLVNGSGGTSVTDTTTDYTEEELKDWGSEANSVKGAAGETSQLYGGVYGIPNVVMADGPAGVRVTQTGYNATAFPIGTLLAQTWNADLIKEVGAAIGEEMEEFGITFWLAPGMNLHRDPINGRNFEYYSEDPTLTGLTGAAITAGVQSNKGVGVTIKHYITNNQETSRNAVNTSLSERASREIYLKGFEIVVKEAQPMAIMSSYNYVDGTYSCENFDLLTSIPRGEWGFQGMYVTDWGAGSRATVQGMMHAGNDIIMSGSQQLRVYYALEGNPLRNVNFVAPEGVTISNAGKALANGNQDETVIRGDAQKCVMNVLKTIMKSNNFAKMNDVPRSSFAATVGTTDYVATAKAAVKSATVNDLEDQVEALEQEITDIKNDNTLTKKETKDAISDLEKRLKAAEKAIKKLEFKAKKGSISSLKAGKKSFTIKYKKITNATRYQIKYSTYSSMKNASFLYTKDLTKTIKNLKSGKTYYVQVRGRMVIDGTKIYTKYSAKKSVKVK